MPGHADLAEPVAVARLVLNGWTDAEARDLWRAVQEATENWIREHTGNSLPKPPDEQTGLYRGRAFSKNSAIRDYPSLILWEMLPEGDQALGNLHEQYGIAPILAVTILAEATTVDWQDVVAPMDFEETMRIFISCWRGLFQLMHIQDVIEQLSETKIRAATVAAISAQSSRAAQARHSPGHLVKQKVLHLYWTGDPSRKMAAAARRIWRQVEPYAIEVGFRSNAELPWKTAYKWIREAEKQKTKAEKN